MAEKHRLKPTTYSIHVPRKRYGATKENPMQAIEFETKIDQDGHIHLPEEFHHVYGKRARLIVLLSDQEDTPRQRRQSGSAKGILTVASEDDEGIGHRT